MPESLRGALCGSMERIITHLLDEIGRKTNAPGYDFGPHAWRESEGRSHHGMEEAMFAFDNLYKLASLADSGLARLRLDDDECRDQNLLVATIFKRFCPELLEVRFIKGRNLNPATLKFAEEMSAKFPRAEIPESSKSFSLATRDPEVSALLESNNPPLEPDAYIKFLRGAYASTATRKLFATCFDEDIYIYADYYFKKRAYHPLGKCCSILAAAEVIKHIIIIEGTQERSMAEDLREFAGTGFTSESDKRTDKVLRRGLAFRRIISIPGRALRKIIRIIRRK